MTSGNFLITRREDEVGRGLHDVHRLQGDHHVDRRVERGDRELPRRTDVHVDDRALVAARLPERVPVVGVQAREPERHRVLRERDRVAALLRDAAHFVGDRLRVPDRRDRERDEALGRDAAPLLDVPVVVRAAERERGVLVVERGEEAAREAGQRREVERTEQRRWPTCRARAASRRRCPGAARRSWSGPSRTPRAGGRSTALSPTFGMSKSRNFHGRCRRACARCGARCPCTSRAGASRTGRGARRRGRRR